MDLNLKIHTDYFEANFLQDIKTYICQNKCRLKKKEFRKLKSYAGDKNETKITFDSSGITLQRWARKKINFNEIAAHTSLYQGEDFSNQLIAFLMIAYQLKRLENLTYQ